MKPHISCILVPASVAEQVMRRAPCPVLTVKPSPAVREEAGYRKVA